MTETKCQYIYYKYLLYVPGVDKLSHFSRLNNMCVCLLVFVIFLFNAVY